MSELELDAARWRALAAASPMAPLDAQASPVQAAQAVLGDGAPDGALDALAVGVTPLAALVGVLVDDGRRRRRSVGAVLGVEPVAAPFVVGVTGGVAVGKSATAHVLAALLSAPRAGGEPSWRVDVVSTDGFLLGNAQLAELGLAERKGFPETYDHRSLIDFLTAVRAGEPSVAAPIYDHLTYDVVAGRHLVVDRPDVVVVEGINVLQPPPPGGSRPASDFLDYSVYVDADETDMRAWYLRRVQVLRSRPAGARPSFFDAFADLSDDQFRAAAELIWSSINGPNLAEHIAPTRDRADLVLEKGADHGVRRVLVRRS